MHTLFSMQDSGNCYKPRLAMAQLGIPFRVHTVDIFSGATHTPEFLAISPKARIPVLQLSDGRTLAESNAMLLYLTEGTRLLPDDAYDRAKVHEWLFWEQYVHEPAIAVARYWWSLKPGGREEKADQFPLWHEKGHAALALMDDHLRTHDFLAANRYTAADIALYGYTHVADEGGFDLAGYPALRAWLSRVAGQPGHVPMDWQP